MKASRQTRMMMSLSTARRNARRYKTPHKDESQTENLKKKIYHNPCKKILYCPASPHSTLSINKFRQITLHCLRDFYLGSSKNPNKYTWKKNPLSIALLYFLATEWNKDHSISISLHRRKHASSQRQSAYFCDRRTHKHYQCPPELYYNDHNKLPEHSTAFWCRNLWL